MRDLRLTRSHRGLVAAVLVLALLAAQALGLAHRAAHGLGAGIGHGHGHGPSTAAAAHRQALDAAPVGLASARLVHAAPDEPSAFDTHEPGSAECRLIDQATHLDVLVAGATTATPPRVPDLRPHAAEEQACSGSIRAYLARGPPRRADEGVRRLG